jgi:aryl-alcohol dehydrogenase-like predicted oxidoreductase
MPEISAKTLVLGSAQWGWNVPKEVAFRLLDRWLAAGHRSIDAATNYPINRNPADFRASEKILAEYIQAHGLTDLKITVKVGSLDNMRSPEVNLSPSFLYMMAGEYLRLFGSNLYSVMLHWDNRSDVAEIQRSLEALAVLQDEFGLQPGLSGIAHPDACQIANAVTKLLFDIQLKHNVLHSDLSRYAPLSEHGHRFFAYGINAGGLKIDADYGTSSTLITRGGQPGLSVEVVEKIKARLPDWNLAFVRPPIKTMNHLGLIQAALHPNISGIILGVSSPEQLAETLDFYRNLEVFDYSDVFKENGGRQTADGGRPR